jgi:glucosylceramidase
MTKTVLLLTLLCGAAAAEPPRTAQLFLTAKGTGDRCTSKGTLPFKALPQPDEHSHSVMVEPAHRFQTIEGIGGALTDAAAETFYKLPADKQREFMLACYSDQGLGYSLGRTNIHSCDFSSAPYTYVREGDAALDSFTIEHDLKYKVPFIKEALKLVPEMKLFASPWSPPAWMKTNNNMLRGGKLKPEYMGSWANYYVRFIEAYRDQGINVWGLTVQNEPLAVQPWESCIFTGEEERDFVRDYLGPTLWNAGMRDVKLMIWDHNRSLAFQRGSAVLSDPEAARYVWGTAFHWYVGEMYESLSRLHDAYPEKAVFFSEGCNGPFSWAKFEDWDYGESYGKSMIHDFNHWAAGWTDWNVLLDETGGPNHVNNFCFAPVHADTRKGTLHYQNSYYYIKHFSRYVRPGARRVACTTSKSELEATAFLNPDGQGVAVMMNRTDKPMPAQLWVDGQAAQVSLPAHSIATLLW